LRKAGIAAGDVVMLHSAFDPEHGFRGTSSEVIDAFVTALGPRGTLLMVSLPYRTSTLEYLRKLERFDVRRTPSAMGLMSEFFRRRAGVLRSLHATHPVLAFGHRAQWFVSGHEDCVYPCGPGTPFARLLEADGKAVFFNVGFEYLTFFHYLEHLVSPKLPFRLYTDELFEVPMLDQQGNLRTLRTRAFSFETIRRRRFERLERWVRQRRLVREVRVGASRILAVRLREIANTVEEMAAQGEYFYDLAGDERMRNTR
jgi:aminoglycoside 3-N-acetyltransferase